MNDGFWREWGDSNSRPHAPKEVLGIFCGRL